MDEDEFDSAIRARPYRLEDAMQAEARSRRISTLGVALWGTSSADLQRQLLVKYPEIPPGYELADFHALLRNVQAILAFPYARLSATIFVGAQEFTQWEARCEIVRRAIDYLENR